MPIPIEDFFCGTWEEWAGKIFTFLHEHENTAFTKEELKVELDAALCEEQFSQALNEAVLIGVVDSKYIMGVQYCIFPKRFLPVKP